MTRISRLSLVFFPILVCELGRFLQEISFLNVLIRGVLPYLWIILGWFLGDVFYFSSLQVRPYLVGLNSWRLSRANLMFRGGQVVVRLFGRWICLWALVCLLPVL